MGIDNGDYDVPDQSTLFDQLASELRSRNDETNPRAETTLTWAFFQSVATTRRDVETDLREVYRSAYIEDATGAELTKKARNLGVIRRDAVTATGVVQFRRDSDATTDYTIPSGTEVTTVETDPISYVTTESVTLASGTSSVKANIEAVEAGPEANVGANAIAAMPSPPTGVDSVTNPEAVGDPTNTDTDGTPLRAGRAEETDAELRDRVLSTDGTATGPNPEGIDVAIERVDGVVDSLVNTNQTNSTVDGIDPYSTEFIVYGGDTADVGRTIFETLSATALFRLQGGVNGTKETTTEYSEIFEQDITIPITRPTITTLTIDIDVVHTDTYAGTDPATDAAVRVVGGELTDGSVRRGTTIGEDVLINEIENEVEDVRGVEYADVTLVDADGDGTDDSTTDGNGVPIYDTAASAVARADAVDITLTETLA